MHCEAQESHTFSTAIHQAHHNFRAEFREVNSDQYALVLSLREKIESRLGIIQTYHDHMIEVDRYVMNTDRVGGDIVGIPEHELEPSNGLAGICAWLKDSKFAQKTRAHNATIEARCKSDYRPRQSPEGTYV